MAEYFSDRRKLRDTFAAANFPGKLRVDCTVFERWEFVTQGICYCGLESPVTYSKTTGLSDKVSDVTQKTLEGTLGPIVLAQLKTGINRSLGYEVNWSSSETTQYSAPCRPPKCGRSDTTIYQLIREFDLSVYRRGAIPFRPNVWDTRAFTVAERISSYAAIPEDVEWDERCKCKRPDTLPEFAGRLSVDAGQLCLLVPYLIDKGGLKLRIGNLEMVFPINSWRRLVLELQSGLEIRIQQQFLSEPLRFYAEMQGDEVAATARIYRSALPEDLQEIDDTEPVFEGEPVVETGVGSEGVEVVLSEAGETMGTAGRVSEETMGREGVADEGRISKADYRRKSEA